MNHKIIDTKKSVQAADRATDIPRAIESNGAPATASGPLLSVEIVPVGAPLASPLASQLAPEVRWAAAVRRRAEQLFTQYDELEPKPLIYPQHIVEHIAVGSVSRRVAFLGRVEFRVPDSTTHIMTNIQVNGRWISKQFDGLLQDQHAKRILVQRPHRPLSMRAIPAPVGTLLWYSWRSKDSGGSHVEMFVELTASGAQVIARDDYARRIGNAGTKDDGEVAQDQPDAESDAQAT